MSTVRVTVDEGRCVGAGQCVLAAPRVFDQRDDDGIVMLLRDVPDLSENTAVAQAVLLCPSAAIHLVETTTS